ncbi:MAG: zf-HC2 domain-containing protein [Chloracidobacterium sp.]|nr:zf-HC2 domain-containing protein [Chloracidobacterium sp.]MCC6825317.1 zf-HC2 domain-containing protein [Acidobacteriota bacterium]MCO5333125.1 zf-HC2 domain-containing protein [Pyrinomonadaceae bacterium]
MNCDECKSSLTAFFESDLRPERAAAVRTHLAECNDCAMVCEELSLFEEAAVSDDGEYSPPNAQALWRRINNIIEGDLAKERQTEPPPPKKRFWKWSIPQIASAMVAIAVISSLLTVVAIKQYDRPRTDDFTLRTSASQTTFEKLMSTIGLIDTPQQARERHIKEQQAAIDYWDQRVKARRPMWDSRTREAFDRNLRVLDQSMNEYMVILAQDPDDELSGEMLDAVLDDKMNLLRDFSDL